MGTEIDGADAEGGGRRNTAPVARAEVQSKDRGEDAGEGVEAGQGEVRRFWADAGGGVSGGTGRDPDQQRDVAEVDDGGGGVEEQGAARGSGARMAAAAELLGGAGAVGHVGA
ncbi:MAG: hypothetical protein ACRD2B_01035 [Terriglobia bacterium]